MTVLDVQIALKNAGFDPGPLDGIAGPKTRFAIRAFQAKNGLEVDGIAGPKTCAKLFGKAKPAKPSDIALVQGDIPPDMPWLAEAKRLVGTTEAPGEANNPDIIDFSQSAGIIYKTDETPWCGLFVSHCLASMLPEEPMPENPLGARNWLKFGKKVGPQFGSVLVFWRGSPQSWKGHVGFYWAEDDLYYHVLGGNQSNAVNVSKYPKARFLGARWPVTVPAKGIRRFAAGTSILIAENAG